ncbi:hypothetical protein Tsubulata_049142 [Turnera subulata]|uniref:DUF4283 domain-containing protein n=1 Tax=Turnera subulata TaxID=218843 RepID=A0A9Q0G5V9_9ROSI|nr:hypothetical protein Tsubulata_049142 [Turnera subulata]
MSHLQLVLKATNFDGNLSRPEAALAQIPKTCLLGRMVSDRHFGQGYVKNMMKKFWNCKGSFDVTGKGANIFVFQFANEEDKKRIVQRAPCEKVLNPKSYIRMKIALWVDKPLFTGFDMLTDDLQKPWESSRDSVDANVAKILAAAKEHLEKIVGPLRGSDDNYAEYEPPVKKDGYSPSWKYERGGPSTAPLTLVSYSLPISPGTKNIDATGPSISPRAVAGTYCDNDWALEQAIEQRPVPQLMASTGCKWKKQARASSVNEPVSAPTLPSSEASEEIVSVPISVCKTGDVRTPCYECLRGSSKATEAATTIVTWNCQGYLDGLRRSLCFDHGDYVERVGLSGGLALWWKNTFRVTVLDKCANFLHLLVVDVDKQKEWFMTCVYNSPNRSDRLLFWDVLKDLQPVGEAWLLMGDFNAVFLEKEKSGGRQPRLSQLLDFSSFHTSMELMDLDFKGSPFIWTNRRIRDDAIAARIDRRVGTVEWRLLFPECHILHEGLFGSDHRPLCLQLSSSTPRGKRLFRFEQTWLEDEHCLDFVRRGWACTTHGLSQFRTTFKLRSTRRLLKGWFWKRQRNARDRITSLIKSIDDLHKLPYTEAVREHEKKLVDDLEDAWKLEEMYWQQ